ncbi:hypothetical protein MS3_00002782 [Schistosoma haematobium]|uniref:Uncharacterized protein n=1 Tax=Schistosoma haematobium TaxID=6185 RepID=A0A095A0P7_SCHHA|nr:hypothetical protein MS3_00002782 [Schistosoma haematobium]CAH8613221.1 unnamed protein product [Schistosoma intercalatum]KAH9589869.1 hypothetical protein MS3_00002782 [Schistosoma haematobium]CAH8614298.1 unnamed protein product [Schistosoma intercalatum]CAH8645688.1 unnamed protein product [Schistosoma haematobium]CAH8652762.1 unnamed protein product [Schistosoma haematobium]
MVSAAKIIYLVAIVTAVVCAVIALAISPFMKGNALVTNSQKVNLSFIIIGTVFLIVAAILVIITFIKYDTMVFMIIIIVILGLAILCFIIALVVIDMNPGYLGWLLAALWVTFLCLLIAIIIWITNSD